VNQADAGAGRYARQVASSLRSVPRAQRKEIASDVRERLVDDGINGYDAAVAALGEPRRYAAELAVAMEVDPPRRRRWPVLAAVCVLAVGAVVVVAARDSVPANYPFIADGTMVHSGAGQYVGSVFVMPSRTDQKVTLGLVWRNNGNRTVRVDAIAPLIGYRYLSGGGVSYGDRPSAWQPKVLVQQLGAVTSFSVNVDDPTGTDTFPFTVPPGHVVFVKLSGTMSYCDDAPDVPDSSLPFHSIASDHITLMTTVGGEQRNFVGPELLFTVGHCS
jgi:hypothetical protein